MNGQLGLITAVLLLWFFRVLEDRFVLSLSVGTDNVLNTGRAPAQARLSP